MLAPAAQRLGYRLAIQTPSPDDPAVAVADTVLLAAIDDSQATARLADQCQWLSFENEFIDLPGLQPLVDQGTIFRPSLAAIAPLLDKYDQRTCLKRLGLPVPDFVLLEDWDRPPPFGFPAVLKARRHGYDGQGTFIVPDQAAWRALGDRLQHPTLLAEAFIPFERELAVLAARGLQGDMVVYPVVETQQEHQVCRRVFAPAAITPAQAETIRAIAQDLLTGLDYVGLLGIELFCTASGALLVNEVAPRAHNSGHYSLEACTVSQFAMQVYAVTGQALPPVTMTCSRAVMVNLLGYESATSDYAAERARLAAQPGAQVYWYGKAAARPGRKLGHVTLCLPEGERAIAEAQAALVEAIWQRQA